MRTQFFATMAAMVAVAVNATRLESSDLIEYDPITFAETHALAEVPSDIDINNEAELDADSDLDSDSEGECEGDSEGEGEGDGGSSPATCNQKCGHIGGMMGMHCFRNCMG